MNKAIIFDVTTFVNEDVLLLEEDNYLKACERHYKTKLLNLSAEQKEEIKIRFDDVIQLYLDQVCNFERLKLNNHISDFAKLKLEEFNEKKKAFMKFI
jgi:hypothetical protein